MTLKASNYPTVRPSLDLNFAQTKRLDPRITYSRASSGTYYDPTGLLKSAATNEARFDHDPTTGESLGLLVEEARTNLLTHSERFEDAAWSKLVYPYGQLPPVVTPNAVTAPDGTITAASVLYSPWGNINAVSQGVPQFAPGTTVTFSVYLKVPSGTAQVYIGVSDDFSTPNNNTGVACNLTTSWQRFQVTFTKGNGTINGALIGWYTAFDNDNAPAGPSVNTTVHVWGAQLEAGSFPTSYIPTPATFTSRSTTATYYDANGTIQTAAINVARDDAYFPDENGVMKPAGLLLEAAGTNLTPQSQTFGNGWTSNPSFNTVTENVTTAPDGTVTADLISETANTTTFYANRNDVPVVAGTTYTFSVFLKKGPGATAPDWISLGFNLAGFPGSFTASFNLATGELGQTGVLSHGITKLPNGWYRCYITREATATTNSSGVILFTNNQNIAGYPAYTGQTTSNVYAWGAQVEASPYPTSYIPTTSSTVTRAADVSSSSTVTRSADVAQITGTNFSSWYNQSEGTVFTAFNTSAKPFSAGLLALSIRNAATTEYIEMYTGNTTTDGIALNVPSGRQFAFYTRTEVDNGKYALALQQDNFAVSKNGGAVLNDTSGLMTSSVSQMDIGGYGSVRLNGHISRLTYYPVRLPDATLQTITS